MKKIKTYEPKTIWEAIHLLRQFLECDLWHMYEDKLFKNEDDFLEYIREHFNIMEKEIKKIIKKEK